MNVKTTKIARVTTGYLSDARKYATPPIAPSTSTGLDVAPTARPTTRGAANHTHGVRRPRDSHDW